MDVGSRQPPGQGGWKIFLQKRIKKGEVMEIIEGLREVGDKYQAIICDVWGVVHNGVSAHPAAVAALENFRDVGGRVVMLTNSPRPSEDVRRQMTQIGVAPDAYDDVVSSGDLTAAYLRSKDFHSVYHLGPSRDLQTFGLADKPLASNMKEGDVVVVTGLMDDRTEVVADYEALLMDLLAWNKTLICANPDRMVKVGDQLLPCAGALAERYEQLGGHSVYLGKPFSFAYEEARNRLHALGHDGSDRQTLIIGDGPQTDIAGANAQKLDCLYVMSGLFGQAMRKNDLLQEATRALRVHEVHANYAIDELRW